MATFSTGTIGACGTKTHMSNVEESPLALLGLLLGALLAKASNFSVYAHNFGLIFDVRQLGLVRPDRLLPPVHTNKQLMRGEQQES